MLQLITDTSLMGNDGCLNLDSEWAAGQQMNAVCSTDRQQRLSRRDAGQIAWGALVTHGQGLEDVAGLHNEPVLLHL